MLCNDHKIPGIKDSITTVTTGPEKCPMAITIPNMLLTTKKELEIAIFSPFGNQNTENNQ